MRFDLSAYLARIGLVSAPESNPAGLEILQQAHRRAITFENLDIPLGRGISLDPDTVFDKLVTRRRGGYCFEHNQLLLRALHALGLDARPLLARVWLGSDGIPPRTHTLNLVRLDGQDWIADAGFGGSYVPLLPLTEAEPVTTADGASHRLRLDPEHGWTLERRGAATHTDGREAPSRDGWSQQCSVSLDAVAPADLEKANHWTSTRPGTRFTRHQVVSIVRPAGFASMVSGALTIAGPDARQEAIDTAATYHDTLAVLFGLDLDESEAARLFALLQAPALS